MGPQDGVDYAVRALARLAERRDDWHAAFLGGGDAFDDVVDLAHRLGLDDRVTFTGMADTPDVRRYLRRPCVGIAPDPLNPLNDVSTMNKIMEYMAMGLPMVSFDLTESRVSAGDAALFARPNDVDEYAALVSELLDDPVRRKQMGEVGASASPAPCRGRGRRRRCSPRTPPSTGGPPGPRRRPAPRRRRRSPTGDVRNRAAPGASAPGARRRAGLGDAGRHRGGAAAARAVPRRARRCRLRVVTTYDEAGPLRRPRLMVGGIAGRSRWCSPGASTSCTCTSPRASRRCAKA